VYGVHHALQGRIEEVLGGFRVEVADQLGGTCKVGKQHRDLLALAFQGPPGGQNFLGEIGGRVGKRRTVLRAGWRSGRVGSGDRGARPDEDIAPLIEGQALALDEFVL
jgi:hypothetical protein